MGYEDRIRAHEGYSTVPYKDSRELLTVGIGRCINRVPFSADEIELMFQNDLKRAKAGAETFYVYQHLNEVRRGVLIEMVFQMGVKGVGTFKGFLSYALQCQYAKAAAEMIDSKWHDQTPERCEALAAIFEKGEE